MAIKTRKTMETEKLFQLVEQLKQTSDKFFDKAEAESDSIKKATLHGKSTAYVVSARELENVLNGR